MKDKINKRLRLEEDEIAINVAPYLPELYKQVDGSPTTMCEGLNKKYFVLSGGGIKQECHDFHGWRDSKKKAIRDFINQLEMAMGLTRTNVIVWRWRPKLMQDRKTGRWIAYGRLTLTTMEQWEDRMRYEI